MPEMTPTTRAALPLTPEEEAALRADTASDERAVIFMTPARQHRWAARLLATLDRERAHPTPPDALREAAWRVLVAVDAYRDAVNGMGHEGEPHDRFLHTSIPGADFEVFSDSTDCSACGGAEYGTEAELTEAHGDLRVALGGQRLSWEGVALPVKP